MTEQQKQHAAEVLLGTKALTGGEDGKYLPRLYVVNGKCYLFLNAARRAAIGTQHTIEVLNIEDAWQICMHTPFDMQREVDWEFDSTGSTFDGYLFSDNRIYPSMVPNPIINACTHLPSLDAILDTEINRLFLSSRALNILYGIGCKTYRDVLFYGRDALKNRRNVGIATIGEIDAEMERVGLLPYWKYNKPIQ